MVAVAVMVVVPKARPVATPSWSIVAIVVRLELHVTPLTEDPFSMDVNCTVWPAEMVCEDGETVRLVPLMLTVRFVLPFMEP